MGMFTSVRHPQDGHELQIKTGWDSCDWYDVGDEVKWSIDKQFPGSGTLLDGVYRSHDDHLIVIKDHIIKAVENPPIKHGSVDIDAISVKEEQLIEKYDIRPLPRELWSEELWDERERREIKYEREALEFRDEMERGNVTPKQQLAYWMTRPLRNQLNYTSIARKLFSVQPLPQNIIPEEEDE